MRRFLRERLPSDSTPYGHIARWCDRYRARTRLYKRPRGTTMSRRFARLELSCSKSLPIRGKYSLKRTENAGQISRISISLLKRLDVWSMTALHRFSISESLYLAVRMPMRSRSLFSAVHARHTPLLLPRHFRCPLNPASVSFVPTRLYFFWQLRQKLRALSAPLALAKATTRAPFRADQQCLAGKARRRPTA